jgi:hypothetical protein
VGIAVGSMPPTASGAPATSPSATASALTASTSGSAAIRPARVGSIVAKLGVADRTTRSAWSPSRTSVPIPLLREPAKIANIVTIAVPSMSASAVEAARRGLAPKLPEAIEPQTPATRRAIGELQRAEAVTIAGPHSTSAGTMATASMSHVAFERTTATAPPAIAAAASTSPLTVRARLTARGSAALSRSASIGGVAAARRAGIQAERIVAPIPTAAATAIEVRSDHGSSGILGSSGRLDTASHRRVAVDRVGFSDRLQEAALAARTLSDGAPDPALVGTSGERWRRVFCDSRPPNP